MAHTSEINDIANNQVDQVVQDFRDAGAAKVTKTQQADGTFSVIATFDDTLDANAEDSAQGKVAPIVGTDQGQPDPAERQTPQINLSWDNLPTRKAWSNQLLASISNCRTQLEQGNPDAFVSGYDNLSDTLKTKFWAELLVAVAKFESSWDPHDIFHEPPPLGVDSVGLLQLSYQDQGNYDLEPISQATRSLEDPLVNLRCGTKIFTTLVKRDNTVASSANGRHRGAATYWSVLRAGHKVDQIVALVRKNIPMP